MALDPPAQQLPARIQALAPDVVNKIAAGEIIVAPVHALKELLENAIDAGATRVEVTIKDGGLKLLQITDNGNGINKDDLPLLCERFTTSKLKEFEDLRSIRTYGFRGEALASISHIAHLTVTTRSASSNGGWRAQYQAGKLSSEPRLVAGNQGTVMMVEDLFYNIPARRRAFRSGAEELSKIVDLLERYSVHFSGVTVLCKKAEARSPVLSVPSSTSNTRDRIRVVYGQDVVANILHLENEHKELAFKIDGWVSNANYTSKKKTVFLLFINHRAVESAALKRAIEQTYSLFLPKGARPFVYVSLEIPPDRVDVNVHPTKKEVHFLREEEVVEQLCVMIRSALAEVDVSRTFMTQTMLVSGTQGKNGSDSLSSIPPSSSTRTPLRTQSSPAAIVTPLTLQNVGSPSHAFSPSVRLTSSSRIVKSRNDASLVRTDHQSQKITSMFPSIRTPVPASRFASTGVIIGRDQDPASEDEETGDDIPTDSTQSNPPSSTTQSASFLARARQGYKPCRLSSIQELRAGAVRNSHEKLIDIFAKHTFIGVADSAARLAVIQSGIRMYIIDYGRICEQFLYQRGLALFGNFGWITIGGKAEDEIVSDGGGVEDEGEVLSEVGVDENKNIDDPLLLPGLDIDYLLDAGVRYEYVVRGRSENERHTETDIDWKSIKSEVKKLLHSRRDMLKEYFSIEITVTSGNTEEEEEEEEERAAKDDMDKMKLTLVTMPVLVRNYFPSLAKLPMFLLRLARDVDWSDEKVCFESFLRHLAKYYTPESLPIESSTLIQTGLISTAPDKDKDVHSGGTATTTRPPLPPSETSTTNDVNETAPLDHDPFLAARRAELYDSLEKAIFPALKKRFIATAETAKMAGAVVEVADLKSMYRTFERC